MLPSELEQIIRHTSWIPEQKEAFFYRAKSTHDLSLDGVTGRWISLWPYDHESHDALPLSARHAKFCAINPHVPAFYVEGYRLKLVCDNATLTMNSIKPNVVYVREKQGALIATFCHASGMIKHVLLTHLQEAPQIEQKIWSNRFEFKQTDEKEHDFLPTEAHAIFAATGVSRATFLYLDVGNVPASKPQIMTKLLDVYRATRNIVVRADSPGCAVVYENQVVLTDVTDTVCFDHEPGFFDHVANKMVSRYGQCEADALDIVKAIDTLFYLTRCLAANEIENEYIQPYVIEQLHRFREHHLPLDTSIMETLLWILHTHNARGVVCPEASAAYIEQIKQHAERGDNLHALVKRSLHVESGNKRHKPSHKHASTKVYRVSSACDGFFGKRKKTPAARRYKANVAKQLEEVKTLNYLQQCLGEPVEIVQDNIREDLLDKLAVFCANNWPVDRMTLDIVSMILTWCKVRKLSYPEITPDVVTAVRNSAYCVSSMDAWFEQLRKRLLVTSASQQYHDDVWIEELFGDDFDVSLRDDAPRLAQVSFDDSVDVDQAPLYGDGEPGFVSHESSLYPEFMQRSSSTIPTPTHVHGSMFMPIQSDDVKESTPPAAAVKDASVRVSFVSSYSM